ncbi:MAG: hypothetical protein OHK0039_28460 [Bacteroidia bacterium]
MHRCVRPVVFAARAASSCRWLVFAFTLLATPAVAQDLVRARALVFAAYNTSDPQPWRQGIDILTRAYETSKSRDALYELALAEYGFIGWCLSSEDCPDLGARLDRTQTYIERLIALEPAAGRGPAMLGALLAMRMGLNPAKAIYLGPRSSSLIAEALEKAPQDPATWVEMGNLRYHAPAIFGGSKTEAVRCFARAVALFDAQPALRRDNWLYLHSLAWLGQAYEATGQRAAALDTYRRALAFAPNFSWVRDELLPALAASR